MSASLTALDVTWALLQVVIVVGIVAAAWAGLRLLQHEPHETRCIVGVDLGFEDAAMVVAHVEAGVLHVDQVHHVRVFRPPFDWSQHPGL